MLPSKSRDCRRNRFILLLITTSAGIVVMNFIFSLAGAWNGSVVFASVIAELLFLSLAWLSFRFEHRCDVGHAEENEM